MSTQQPIIPRASDTQEGPGWWQASDGKWYPPQPQQQAAPNQAPPLTPPPAPQVVYQQAPKKGHGCLYAILGAVGLVVVIGVIALAAIAVSANKVSKTVASGNLGGAAPAAKYKVGDTASTGAFSITVYAAKDPQPAGNSLLTPTVGGHFVSVDVQVTNPGSSQQAFSSLVGFHLLDSVNHQYDESLGGAGLTPGAPDGEIAGGQSIRGYVVFEVPDGTTGLKFRAQGNLTAAGAVWTLS
jgi:hypothetical protein